MASINTVSKTFSPLTEDLKNDKRRNKVYFSTRKPDTRKKGLEKFIRQIKYSLNVVNARNIDFLVYKLKYNLLKIIYCNLPPN